MMKRFWFRPASLAFVTVVMVGGAVPAVADETGLHASHALRRESGRVCFVDHWHYGSSGLQSSRKQAERAAIGSWASFVAFEYGTDWARFGRAASKKMTCSQNSSGWDCSLEARPCK